MPADRFVEEDRLIAADPGRGRGRLPPWGLVRSPAAPAAPPPARMAALRPMRWGLAADTANTAADLDFA